MRCERSSHWSIFLSTVYCATNSSLSIHIHALTAFLNIPWSFFDATSDIHAHLPPFSIYSILDLIFFSGICDAFSSFEHVVVPFCIADQCVVDQIAAVMFGVTGISLYKRRICYILCWYCRCL